MNSKEEHGSIESMHLVDKVKNRLISVPFIALIVIVLFLYMIGLFANQSNLITTIESYRIQNTRLKKQLSELATELEQKKILFVPAVPHLCLTKPYVPSDYIISPTDTSKWCNIRAIVVNGQADKGFDIFFPATASIEMRGSLAVFQDSNTEPSKTLFLVREASAEATQVGSYDSIVVRNGISTSKFIQDTIVSKQVIRIHEKQVLQLITKDKLNKKVEHYLVDNGNIKNKAVYDIIFYADLPQEEKNIILNSFSPRFE